MHPFRYLLLIVTFVVQNNVLAESFFPMVLTKANGLMQKINKLKSNRKPNLPSIRGGANDESNENIDIQTTSSLLVAGEFLPKFRKFLIGSTASHENGWMELYKVFYLFDIAFIAFFALVFAPLSRILYKALPEKRRSKDYDDSRVSKGVMVVSEAGQIAAYLYLVELFFVYYAGTTQHDRLDIGDVEITLSQIPQIIATTIYGFWGAKKLTIFTSQFISDYISNSKNFPVGAKYRDRQSLIPLYQRFTTTVIYSAVTYGILDACSIGATEILKSFIALGGLSSIVIGLALKDPASHLLAGVLILLKDRFRSGENIELSDGTKGKVINIGWTETLIQSSDNISVNIPNSEIIRQRMSNLSRTPRSQVKMDLRFRHEDMDRVHEITSTIKEEISASCRKLIVDGSRPFRVIWKDINHNHIVVSIDSHYDIPPSTGEYWENREQVLLAISRALKKVGVKLALPVEVSIHGTSTLI